MIYVYGKKQKQYFQDDLFPPVRKTWESVLSADDFFQGAHGEQDLLDLAPKGMTPGMSIIYELNSWAA